MKKTYRIIGAVIFLASSLFVSGVFAQTSSTYGSALNFTGVSDIFSKIWGPGNNGIILGGGLNFSTQVGVSWAQQYGGTYVTSYSIQGVSSPYLTQTDATGISVTGPSGSIIEVWDLESMMVVATNRTTPGTQTMFYAQPNHRYGGFAWYADNSQKSIEIHAVLMTSTSPMPVMSYQCSDKIDNDHDGLIDYPADIGCYGSNDSDESNVVTTTSIATTTTLAVIQSQTPEETKLATQQVPQGYAIISGTLTDASGVVLKTAGYAEVFNVDTTLGKAGGTSFFDGKFAVSVSPGTYYVRVYLPPGSGYSVSQVQKITITDAATVQFVASANVSVVTGKVMEGMNVASGIAGRIIASNKEGAWQETAIAQDDSYSMNLGVGTWLVGIEIAPGSGYVTIGDRLFSVDVLAGATRVERNFMVQKAATVVDGYVLDQNGVGVGDVYVAFGAGEYSPSITSTDTNNLNVIRNTTTDSKGYFSVTLPPGRYYIKTFVRADRGYINAQERRIDVVGSRLTANLSLQKPDVTISGSVYSSGAPVSNAFVWAWSKTGGYQEALSNTQGVYSLRVLPNTSWIVAAAAHINATEYRSDEIAVDVGLSSAKHDVELRTNRVLPKAAILQTSATAPAVLTVASGGPTVVAPANAFSSSGSVEIAVVPDTRAPSQGQTKVVGTAYDFSASSVSGQNTSGQKITNFADEVVITIPYTDADIASLGVNEKSLVLSYWDEGVSAWKNIDNSMVNTAANIVTASVNHFTRYAILAPADVTPPDAPTVMTASALGAGKIKIAWTNPTKDFDHAKVYRSTLKGILGSIVVSEIAGAEYIDVQGIVNGLMYYYTVRAVDPAGNESNNMLQTSATAIGSSTIVPAGTTVPPTGVSGNLTRTLKLGSRGDDVSVLQRLLVQENVYPEAKITTYFGSLTKAAVKRFQEKYATEVLTPAGLTKGSGVVGAFTRAKMNALMK